MGEFYNIKFRQRNQNPGPKDQIFNIKWLTIFYSYNTHKGENRDAYRSKPKWGVNLKPLEIRITINIEDQTKNSLEKPQTCMGI